MMRASAGYRRPGSKEQTYFSLRAVEGLSLACGFALVCVAGCRVPWSASDTAQSYDTTTAAQHETHRVAPSSSADAKQSINPNQPTAKTQEEAMAEVEDELKAIGAIDPGAKQQLIKNLHEAEMESWPLMVQQFQASLAYSQQLAAREARLATDASSEQEISPASHVEGLGSSAVSPPKAEPISVDLTEPTSSARKPSLGNRQEFADSPVAFPEELTIESAKPLPPPHLAPPVESSNSYHRRAQAAMQSRLLVQQASYELPVSKKQKWREVLDESVRSLEQEAPPSPGTTDEVHLHMRLRLLQMLANQEEAAFAPIPGASAAQQDYWNKQICAMKTFLDSTRQPDDKQRAAASLVHFDQARGKLAELASLQIRNLEFVSTVEGYGVYQQLSETKFRPGEQVTLYAAVENFSSESTPEGHRTTLGTSYEVVDTGGQRVDGRQFPEVEDWCQHVRRDFHLQYGVDLPTRIYPGTYELRLIITDLQSHKIGQASVPFEIVE